MAEAEVKFGMKVKMKCRMEVEAKFGRSIGNGGLSIVLITISTANQQIINSNFKSNLSVSEKILLGNSISEQNVV